LLFKIYFHSNQNKCENIIIVYEKNDDVHPMKGLTTVYDSKYHQNHWDGRRRDSVVAGFTTACVISANNH
jgi:hypothetical protein